MLEGYSLVYLGPSPWAGMWRNRHQLMSRFARRNRVMYVEPAIYLRTLRRRVRTGEWSWRNLQQELAQDRAQAVGENLYVYHSPKLIPLAGRFPLDRLTQWLWVRALRSTLRRLRFERSIVWLSRPEMKWLIGRLGERMTIYHMVDEYTAYQDVTKELAEALSRQERQLMSRANLVLTVSPALWEAKRAYNPETHLVMNGVDVGAFVSHAHSVPTDLAPIPQPRLVYAGLIGARLDLELLTAVAQRNPEWAIVLIGEVNPVGAEAALERLRAQANVHFLGLKPAAAIPGYLLASDVCILPYRQCAETHHIDPLKLYESLAAGKPIVAAPIPAVTPYANLVELASTVEAFETGVRTALAEGAVAAGKAYSERVAQRQAVAAANTWDARVEQISELIGARLADMAN